MGLIQCKEVSRSFGEKTALDRVSIDIPEAKVFGLLGPNGAGKTTLIRIINRIIMQDSGEVLFNGRPITQSDVERIGYLPEERGLYRKMKVGEQAMYFARLKGMSSRDALAELKKWFVKFGIQSWWNRKVEELCDEIALINLSRLVIAGGVDDIRHMYGNNNVELVYTASRPVDSVPGLFDVLSDTGDSSRHTAVLSLVGETDTTAVLRRILDDGAVVNSFKELVPRMNDIFIKLVTEGEYVSR